MKYLFLCLTFSIVVTSCSDKKNEPKSNLCFESSFSQNIEKASFNNMQHLNILNAKFIEISGVFRYNFEDVALYPLTSEKTTDALWTNFRLSVSIADSVVKAYSNKKVLIIGKLNTSKKGHLGSYFAEIDSVFCIKLQ